MGSGLVRRRVLHDESHCQPARPAPGDHEGATGGLLHQHALPVAVVLPHQGRSDRTRTQRRGPLRPRSAAPTLNLRRARSARSFLTNPLGLLLVPGYEGIDHPTQGATQNRRDPEEPELLESPYVCKDSGAGAACWIERKVRNRDSSPIDERYRPPDCQGCKALRRPTVRRAHNDQEEKKGKHRLSAEARQQRIAGRRVLAVAVGGKASGHEALPPCANEIEKTPAEDPTDHLGGNIAGNLVCGKSFAEHEAHSDGWIDMAT